MTCAELIEFSMPALFVPRELSVGDHQWKNAAPLAALGASESLREKDWSAEVLMDRVRGWLAEPGRLDEMRAAYAPLRRPDAAADVAARVLEVAGRQRKAAA
jgi:UDP-N-acetylglucosamine--N-acetylmuramyl-(pentapeptide) pyrophosphoryl-undecaprenol N-acetylglucosamine transferase